MSEMSPASAGGNVSEDATVHRALKIEWHGVGVWASVRVRARVNCENEMREKVTTDGCVWLKELGVCDVHSPHFLLHHWWFQLDFWDDERRAWVVVPPVTSAVYRSQQPDASGRRELPVFHVGWR